MAYIGKQPVVGNFVKLDAITTSATATYNLLNGGVAYFPQTANNCIVSLNGVIQSPTSAYTISGSTIVFSDALTASDTIDFILVLGDVLSIGTPSDGTITSAKLASGLSGLISWQSVQTTGFTASAGRGYPLNTTSAAFTVTLPASPSVGDTIILLDYAGTFATNNITLGRNSNKIEGVTTNKLLTTNREAVTLVYVDSTQGWVSSSGANEGTQSIDPITYSIDFLVVAGGGGSGIGNGGGGGAGGYRTSTQTVTQGTAITVTVGDGGATSAPQAASGSNSSISGSGLTTITSAGGGGSGGGNTAGANGGSGGGGGNNGAGGSGNTPSTSPSQGNNAGAGANNAPNFTTGGGGGAGVAGANGLSTVGGLGGNGTASSITGSSVTYAGGGGGSISIGTGGTGGTGGGGNGGVGVAGTNGTANTGGGAGGTSVTGSGCTGGKGVVILSVPTANYSSTTTGSPTVTTSGSNTILQFNGSGSYTA
jgi:hypothetical protein